MIARSASDSILKLVSTTLPPTRPARAALARPGPIESATSATVTGAGKLLTEPSGKRICGIEMKNAAAPRFLCVGRRDWTRTNDPHHVKVVL